MVVVVFILIKKSGLICFIYDNLIDDISKSLTLREKKKKRVLIMYSKILS